MSKELRECPFCGNLLEIVHKNGIKYVRCISGTCIFETARHGHHISDDELIKRCNRRPTEDALKAENKRLKEKLENVKKHLAIHRDHAIQSYRQDGKAYRIMNDFLARFCNNLLKVIDTNVEKKKGGGEDE